MGRDDRPRLSAPGVSAAAARADSYLCLNGLWDYTVQDGEEYTRRRTGKILVPFSPESLLSGCDFQLQSGETLWYERTFTLPEGFRRARVLLHFGAVDQCSRVLVNDRPAGHHEGGYLPFCMDITELLVPGENRLTVAVTDDAEGGVYAFGSSATARRLWYTATSGSGDGLARERAGKLHKKYPADAGLR